MPPKSVVAVFDSLNVPALRLIASLGVLAPVLLKDPAATPRSSPVELTFTVVVFAVVATCDNDPVTLAISTPLLTLNTVPLVRSVAAAPRITVPLPVLPIVRAVPPSPSAPSVSVVPRSATFQVWFAPRTIGALMVTPVLTEPVAMLMPSVEDTGAIASELVDGVPELMVTLVVAPELLF